jgi:hypothetical protein
MDPDSQKKMRSRVRRLSTILALGSSLAMAISFALLVLSNSEAKPVLLVASSATALAVMVAATLAVRRSSFTVSRDRTKDAEARLQRSLQQLELAIRGAKEPKHEEAGALDSKAAHDGAYLLRLAESKKREEQYLQDAVARVLDQELENRLRAQVVNADGSDTTERLKVVTEALRIRGNVNLFVGMFFAMVGFLALGYMTIFVDHSEASMEVFLIRFIPKLSFVLLLEFLAYFFLRLYKATLLEIRYFQNEITNAEARGAAVRLVMAVKQSEPTAITNVINELIRVERNHILGTGQTTLELERARIDAGNLAVVVEALSRATGQADQDKTRK